MLNKLKWPLFVISCALVISCTPKPPDIFVFEFLPQRMVTDPATGHLVLQPSPTCMAKIGEPECGHGVAIVSGSEIFVGELPQNQWGGKPWSQLKTESVYLPSKESYAPLATYIINSCKQMNCSAQVDAFRIKLGELKELFSK